MKLFRDYKDDAPNQITMANGAFYPDILDQACILYKPVLVYFGQLLKVSPSSEALLRENDYQADLDADPTTTSL